MATTGCKVQPSIQMLMSYIIRVSLGSRWSEYWPQVNSDQLITYIFIDFNYRSLIISLHLSSFLLNVTITCCCCCSLISFLLTQQTIYLLINSSNDYFHHLTCLIQSVIQNFRNILFEVTFGRKQLLRFYYQKTTANYWSINKLIGSWQHCVCVSLFTWLKCTLYWLWLLQQIKKIFSG